MAALLSGRLARSAAVLCTSTFLLAGCGSADDAAPVITDISAASTLAPSTTNQATSTTSVTPAQAQRVDYARLDSLLPDLSATTSSATQIVELQNRTLEVSTAGSMLCLGGGELGLEPDTCADLTSAPGILTYTDNGETRVSAWLTAGDVSVVFLSASGVELSCYNEPISAIGPLVLSWCENEFAPVVRFEVANGPRLEIVIG